MRLTPVLWPLWLCLLEAVPCLAEDGPSAPKHEAGRCAIRGTCGSSGGWFGTPIPCPDNGSAEEPDTDLREKLVDICGEEWLEGKVCCDDGQLDTLKANLNKANQIISSCPACKTNFANLFCTFTCSPDQSLFVNVTATVPGKGDKQMVGELDYLVTDKYGSGFYDSCKEVKFGGAGKAMDLIGGGAKNYTNFLQFLGDKKFLGSPFQMNFPRPSEYNVEEMDPMDQKARKCNDEDKQYRCTCVDCPESCLELPQVHEATACHIGALPCMTFGVIIAYSTFLVVLVFGVSAHVAYQKHAQSRKERLRLLHDAAPSDDEDEGDVVHNVGLLDYPQKHYRLNTLFDRLFSRLGALCAEYPAITVSTAVMAVFFLSIGWINFAIETDPVKLWVAPNSAAAQEQLFFDSNFGRFYRTQQVFVVNDTVEGGGPVLSYDTLRWWFDVEARVRRLKAAHGVTLDDICFKPVEDECVVQSVTGYFGGDVQSLDPNTWPQDLESCAESPVNCLPPFQQPLKPDMVLGGWNESVLDAKSLIITWVVSNHPEGSEELESAMNWENALAHTLVDVQREASQRGLRVSYRAEVSIEQELNKSTNTDATIVAVSYLIMFIYASLALGSTTLSVTSILNDPTNAIVQSKFMLGVVGIIIVLMSVSASVGLFAACGVKVTLIIAEVIPFLVLAVGVDNIFLIVHEFERVNISHPDTPIEARMARALGRMGPSIFLSSITETVAFALGAAVGMPAVRNFAIYAAGAVFINAVLQVTLFVSILALNQKRVEDGRVDCIPCIQLNRNQLSGSHSMVYGFEDESSLQTLIRKAYAPAILDKKTKVVVLTFFLSLFAAGLALIPKIELGLDQRIALPSDSYLIQFFNDFDKYFQTGPPVYFVTRELNITQREHQEQLCGRFLPCDEHSLANVLEMERRRPEISYIGDSTASWVDDYFLWLNPTFEYCCTDKPDKTCFQDRDPPWNSYLNGMPEGEEYVDYLQRWLAAPTTSDCPLAGQAAYGNAVAIDSNRTTILASQFRTSHTPLRSQADFIAAYRSARRIAADISARHGISVFPYSPVYVFFDQYLSIVRLAGGLLGGVLALILLLSSVLLGSIQTGLVVTTTVAMTLVDILGIMALAHVSLNAVSLVNLIICAGIALEFCAHMARAFSFPSTSLMERAPRHAFRGKDARAWTALVNVGASVFSGITITKLLGVAVLAFTRSKIFEIYYFRIWVALVAFAAAHALVFLPVALSLFGGEGYVDPESEGGLEQDLRNRRYPALLDDDYDSDDF